MRVWGLGVPSQGGPVCHLRATAPGALSEPSPVHVPLVFLGFGAEERPRSDISCPLCHSSSVCTKEGRGGIFEGAPGHGDGERRVLGLPLLFSSLQKAFKSYSFLSARSHVPAFGGGDASGAGDGSTGRFSALKELNPPARSSWAITQLLLQIPEQVPSLLASPPHR